MSQAFQWAEWEEKLRQLTEGGPDVGRYRVRVRHWTRSEPRGRGGAKEDVQRLAVYHSRAEVGERPLAIFEVPAEADLTSLPDGAVTDVEGWPEVGGAIAIDVGGVRVTTTSPGDLPMFRVPRFEGGPDDPDSD